jgi:nitrite reductase (NADH) small subunit
MKATMAWGRVARFADIPHRCSRVVATALGDTALFRCTSDNAYAVDDKCPHKGGPLSQAIVHGRAVTCPLHNKVIDLDSGEAQAPDFSCVWRKPVKLKAGSPIPSFCAGETWGEEVGA